MNKKEKIRIIRLLLKQYEKDKNIRKRQII